MNMEGIIRPAETLKGKIWVLFLYFLPGVVITLVLYKISLPLSGYLHLGHWFTQILLLLVFLFLLELVIVWLNGRYSDGLSFRSIIGGVGLNRFSWKNIGIAILWGIAAVILFRLYMAFVGEGLMAHLQSVPWLAMPQWHYQSSQMPSYSAASTVVLMIIMLGTNIFCEEVYFRGYICTERPNSSEGLHGWPMVCCLLRIIYSRLPSPTRSFRSGS